MSSFLASLTLEHWFFYPLALLALASALGVVLFKSPLRGALSLICCFFFLAGIYVLLGAHFVGILQILVYAGAIMVLFVFVIMLLSIEAGDLGRPRVTLFKIAAALGSVALIGIALKAFGLRRGASAPLIMWIQLKYQRLPSTFGTLAEVGRVLLREQALQIEAVGLLLLVAIVGSVVLAKKRI